MGTLTTRLVLAQLPEDAMQSLRQAFRTEGHSTDDLMWIATAVGALALLLVLLQLLTRRRQPGRQQRPNHLKRALRTLGLGGAERRLVRRLAERANLADPVAMLLAPSCLADAVRRSTVGEPDPALEAAANDLCRQLFDVDLPQRQPSRLPR